MLIGNTQHDLQSWRNEMHIYEKQKRTKKPFGKQFKPLPERITNEIVQTKQRQFDPVLQTFSDPNKQSKFLQNQQLMKSSALANHMKRAGRYSRDFDIVNLHGGDGLNSSRFSQSQAKKSKQPVRNLYNPINNKPLPQFYYEGRTMRLPHEHQFKNLSPKKRQFDIVKCRYYENSDEKEMKQKQLEDSSILNKYKSTHAGYDPVFGKYYDNDKQTQYQQNLAKSQIIHGTGQQYRKRFPPSYNNRQPLILDPSKPLTQSLQALDYKRANAKQRYRLKYLIQQQYNRRNIQDFQKKEAQVINRIHNSHVIQNKAKEFDIVNLSMYDQHRAQKLHNKDVIETTWDKINQPYIRSYQRSQSSNRSGTPVSIKSSGFI